MKKLFILAIAALGMLACTDQNSPSNQNAKDGALPGKFSVSTSKKVQFSQGNLQYKPSTETWRFAENQYDAIGRANANISATYNGWIDLFGWGTGDYPTMVSEDYDDYKTFIDWGINKISNGGNKANLWRTLTADEWIYMLGSRPKADQLLGTGNINGLNGLIILPDDWSTPSGVNFVAVGTKLTNYDALLYYADKEDCFTHNTYSIDEWAKMEKAGAVFLPAAGDRHGAEYVQDINAIGFYWYSTEYPEPNDQNYYYHQICFSNMGVWLLGNWTQTHGFSVRLVR